MSEHSVPDQDFDLGKGDFTFDFWIEPFKAIPVRQLRSNEWTHIAVDGDMKRARMYINGRRVRWWHSFLPSFLWRRLFLIPKGAR